MSQWGRGGLLFRWERVSFLSEGRGCHVGGNGCDGGGTPHALPTMGNPGGYILQKNRIGREVGFLIFFFSTFLSLFFFLLFTKST